MNFRQTAILISAVFAVGLVLFILTFITDDKTPETDSLTEELVAVKPDQIDTVEIERDGATLKMVRTDAAKNTWEIVEPYHAPAEANAINAIITALMRAKPIAHPELTSNLAFHGLEPAGLKVTLRQGTDKASIITIGNISIGGSKAAVFVTTSKRPKQPMAVTRSDLEPLFKDPKPGKASEITKWTPDFRTHAIFPSDSRAMGEDVSLLKLNLPNKKKDLTLSRTQSGGWKFDNPAGWGEADAEGDVAATPGKFSGVNPLLRALTNMSAGSAADFIENPSDLKQYGLNPDNPDLVVVEMKTKDGKTAKVTIGKTEGGTQPEPKMPGMPSPPSTGKAFVMIEGQPGVIRANAGDLKGLAAVITDPSPLRDRALITLEPRMQVDGLDIVLAGQPADKPTKLRRIGNDWKLYGGPGDPQNAFRTPIDHLIDVVVAKRAIKDFPAPNPANFAAVSATIFVYVDGFNPHANPTAEPTKKAEPVKIEFGRKEGDTIYVRRTRPGGQVNEFAIPETLKIGAETVDPVRTVLKTRLDFLDPTLVTFSSDAVAKLTVTGQNNYTLEKDTTPDPTTKETLWHFTAPEPKGRVADARSVEELLRLLGTTQAVTRFVDESPTPEKLTEYGFTPAPRLKVVVGLKEKGGERIYEFGKDTADPNFVYARVGGKAAVFTLPRFVFDKLASPDLRDRVVFRFDPAKATAIDLRGWGILKLGEQKLRIEKNKDGIWVGLIGENKAPFAVDPTKVEKFLRALADARAKTFITGSDQKPEYGFGDANYLVVEITLREGEPIYMNLGAPTDGGASYFAFSRSLPKTDPFFTLDAAPLRPFKEGPAGFAK